MRIYRLKFLLISLISPCLFQQVAEAQCTTPINVFPYNEGFEASDGGWVRSSVAHWEWGQINTKPVITAAGGGLKCWIVGGYSGSQYNSGSSYVQSPCFDISTLSNPRISFKVFWETERKYDGVTFQYSLDGGTVWTNLGSANSNDGCSIENWFNYDPIFTSNLPGWSGNIQPTSGSCQGTGGSGQWVTATHPLSSIAGATGVIFRFVFSAGTTCNGFDGFAFDDVQIDETPPNGVNYTFTCGPNKTIDFTGLISGCVNSVSWDFADPASGANNTSTSLNTSHTFSSPGSYTVVLTANFSSGPSLAVAKTINVIAVSSFITDNIKCKGDHNGSVIIQVAPGGTYNYSWDTNPVQTTPSISNLGAGTYTVTVSGTNVCTTTFPVVLTEPDAISIGTTITNAHCGSADGMIVSNVTGGTGAYTYTWSNSGSTPSISNLSAGTYSLLVSDANNCTATADNLVVANDNTALDVTLGKDTSICPGDQIILTPGVYSSYLWQDNSTSPTYIANSAGTYSVKVINAGGCTGSASINIFPGCTEIYFPSGFTPNNDGRNDGFGPLPQINLSTIRQYKLIVYGRWGEILFSSTNPFKRWDGTYKGKPLPTQVCAWTVTYTQNSFLPVSQSGTVTIIR